MKHAFAILAFILAGSQALAGITLYKGISKYSAGDKETSKCTVIVESDSYNNIVSVKVEGTIKSWDAIQNDMDAMAPKTEYARTVETIDVASGVYEKRDHWFNDGFTLSTRINSQEIRTNGRNELQVDVKDSAWVAIFFKNSIKTMAVLPLATKELGCFNLVKIQGN